MKMKIINKWVVTIDLNRRLVVTQEADKVHGLLLVHYEKKYPVKDGDRYVEKWGQDGVAKFTTSRKGELFPLKDQKRETWFMYVPETMKALDRYKQKTEIQARNPLNPLFAQKLEAAGLHASA